MPTPEAAQPNHQCSAPRGASTACGTFHQLNADGTLRAHQDFTTHHRCVGSDKMPVATTETDG